MTIAELIQEFEAEAKTTRRVLERVPSDKLTWTPHTKSMTLGRLAMHLASAPAAISSWPIADEFQFKARPDAAADVHRRDRHRARPGRGTGQGESAEDRRRGSRDSWSGKAGGKTLMTMPKAGLLRALLMNHTYHHRGQLSVYLRLLDVPVPPIYGPSADENPFK